MKTSFWNGKKVLVTAGCGFIGSHLVEELLKAGSTVTILDNLSNGSRKNIQHILADIELIEKDCRDMANAELSCKDKDIVLNLAAKVRGIEYNRLHPGMMLSENLLIETVMIEAARRSGVPHFLAVSSAVVYPPTASIPTPESEGFIGEPDTPNKGYGWAKRLSELLGKYYLEEFGMKVAIVRPYNCYGPRDHFFPEPTHVIPSLIRRVVDGEDPVTVWGSGKQTRAFLYVEDLVRGMMLATEKYAVADPVNLGSDEEVTMKELVEKILNAGNRQAKIIFDTTKPDGSPRRNSDNTKAKEKMGFIAQTPLDAGLQKTIEWYNTVRK